MTEAYEMLWDCRHCGTTKLLGLTHRYCPACGASQVAEHRYFPADADKVAVADHVYAGRDIACAYCGTYNGKAAKHCKDCGGPLSEGKEAQTRQDQLHAAGQFAGETVAHAKAERAGTAAGQKPKQKPKSSLALKIIGLVFLGLLVFLLVFLFWKKEGAFVVAGHQWQREIDVERFGPVKDSVWCDELPAGARDIERRRAVRKHEDVQVGEDCQTRKTDRGDGTFTEQQECKPRYEKKPVHDDKCEFTLERWSKVTTAKAEGSTTEPAPAWPEVKLARTGCEAPGCEREGERREKYTVEFKNSDDGELATCEFEAARWQSIKAGQSFKAKVGVVGGRLDCASLSAE